MPTRTARLSQHLQQAMPAAQRLCICTGYVSAKGLQFLAEWLDQMDPQAEAQLLIGDAAHRLEIPTLYRHGRRHLYPQTLDWQPETTRDRRRAPEPGGVAAAGRP